MSSTLGRGGGTPGLPLTAVPSPPKLPPEELPKLGRGELLTLAREHLTALEEAQRRHVADRRRARLPVVQQAGRRVRREWMRVRLAVERVRRAAHSPQHALGRRIVWWRMVAKPQKLWDPRVLAALGGVALLLVRPVTGATVPEWVAIAYATVVGLPAAGSLVVLWDDFVRCPFQAWQIRRRIRKFPACILPSTPAARGAALIPREDMLGGEIIPRDDLYYEVLPGILRRHHRDVQVVVGEPGSGKTTALVGLAGLLAKIGIVPVLVPLRGQSAEEVVDTAEEVFKRQASMHVRSADDADTLWRWLYRRKRIAVLTDDIDQIGPDGERGFVLRRTLDMLATEDLPIVVTARPAGIPAGVAASSIDLGQLREAAVVKHVRKAALRDPGADPELAVSERELSHWVREGRLNEAPFYLELLASLFAAGKGPELPEARVLQAERGDCGCFRKKPGGAWGWNPLWVRFRLLERYYEETAAGAVRRWLGIEPHERKYSLNQLQGAALGMLRVTGCEAQARTHARFSEPEAAAKASPLRRKLQDFLEYSDRTPGETVRAKVSAHEVVDTGERLRIVDRDHAGELQFHHRIMQAHLAARRLADDELNPNAGPEARKMLAGRLRDLLDPDHPEKLTAHMTISFAALRAYDQGQRAARVESDAARARCDAAKRTCDEILRALIDDATRTLHRRDQLPEVEGETAVAHAFSASTNGRKDPFDPREPRDAEEAGDPDDALLKLATAADIAQAIDDTQHTHDIVRLIQLADGATRWTKLGAIASIAALEREDERWQRIWEFARDCDYRVRRAASEEIQRNANVAYEALQEGIAELIIRAAARSALDLPLLTPSPAALDAAGAMDAGGLDIVHWREHADVLALKALGWILPAIVSGLREESFGAAAARLAPLDGSINGDPAGRPSESERQAAYVRSARQALEWLVALAFEGGHHDLEASVAQGFKGDAMRHAEDPEARVSGPGWVASNRRLVADICLHQAEFWYSRMLLHQALALYAIAGASANDTFESFARFLDSGREQHEFVRRAAKLARRALERKLVHSKLWNGLIWNDEGEVVSRRATALDDGAALLVADVTLLLNLNERSGEDRQAQFGYMRDLPYCLCGSADRREILGGGCPSKCGWGLCPYKQPPPDEPNAHRGVSRAFCRQQQQIAARRRRAPVWQGKIRRRALEDFWWEMERRART